MVKDIKISKDGSYRYYSYREWDNTKPCVMFIQVNPCEKEDYNIDNLVQISKDNGYGSFYLCNLFSYITKDTHILTTMPKKYSIGGYNDDWLLVIADRVKTIVLSWGVNGKIGRQCDHVEKLLSGYKLYCLGQDEKGYPLNTLYTFPNTIFIPYVK